MRGLLRLAFARLSVFTAVSLSCGAAAALSAHFVDASHWGVFTFGALHPIGPLTFYFSSSFSLRGRLASWQKMQNEGLLTLEQFRHLRQTAVDWYTQRWYGRSEVPELGSPEADESQQSNRPTGRARASTLPAPEEAKDAKPGDASPGAEEPGQEKPKERERDECYPENAPPVPPASH